MNQLTNFYKNKAEILAEQIKFLENQLKQLAEDAPGYSFTPGNKNAPRQSDADLQARARSIKKSGLFGAEISDDKQSQEYRDIQAELASRKGTQTSAGNLEKTQPKTSIPAAPPATVTRSTPPTIAKPKVELRPPAPTPIQKGGNKSYDEAESVRSRRSAETQADRQRAATPDLLQRDPSVPTPPKTGSPAPVSDKQKGVPTQATAAPSTAGKQAADNTPDWIKNISKPFTLPSDFVGDRSGSKQPSYDFNKNSSDLMSKAAQLLGKFKNDTISGSSSSTGMGSGANNRSQTPTQNSTPRNIVQGTNNPKVSYYVPNKVEQPKDNRNNLGVIQLIGKDTPGNRAELEKELGYNPKRRNPITQTTPATPGVDVEGPASPAPEEQHTLMGDLGHAFYDAGRALFNLPRDVNKALKNGTGVNYEAFPGARK
jgi:hypothetical protein